MWLLAREQVSARELEWGRAEALLACCKRSEWWPGGHQRRGRISS